MRTLAVIIAAALAVAGGAALGWGQVPHRQARPQAGAQGERPKPDREKVRALMRRKMDQSQGLLEALMKNDLAKAGRHAEELARIRKDASFAVVPTPTYELWAGEFASGAEKVAKAAREKNFEVAKLGYLEMTMTCFHCHAYYRDLRDVSLEAERP
jgi:hypothetical protein